MGSPLLITPPLMLSGYLSPRVVAFSLINAPGYSNGHSPRCS